MTDHLGAGLGALRLGWRVDRRRSASVVLVVGLAQAASVVVAVLLRSLLDAVIAGREHDALAAALTAAAVMFVSYLGYIWSYDLARLPLVEAVSAAADEGLMRVFGAGATLDVHDRTDLLDAAELVRTHRRDLGESFEDLTRWTCMVLQLLASVALLAFVDARLLLLPAFAVPSVLATRSSDSLRRRAEAEAGRHRRRARELESLMTRPGPAREIRVFGLGDVLVERHTRTWAAASVALDRASRRAAVANTVAWVAFVAGYVGAIALVVRAARDGTATLGDVVLTLALASQVSGQVQGVLRDGHYLLLDLRVSSAFQLLLDHLPAGAEGRVAPPAALHDGIRLEHVSFRYPGADVDAVHDVSLELPAGAVVAVVGENGAGKSTLVKLLAGLHLPAAGRITVDGTDLAALDPATWQHRIAAAFQDLARFELTAQHAVGVGDLSALDDAAAVGAALESVGAPPVATWLRDGLATRLGRSWGDGAELSGGQWQTIALARAAMRQTPLLLLLDEPTASLDPLAEQRVFEQHLRVARSASRETGAVTILVTHRIAAAPGADLIVFLDHGRVAEIGPHRVLLAGGGAYARLFDLQRRSYRSDQP